MNEEFNAIMKNNKSQMKLPPGKQALDLLWVIKKKVDANGNIARYKARLCVQGSRQLEGIDYNETFAPVVSFVSLRVLLALTAFHDWECIHLDVDYAFLKGNLGEEIYVRQPQGFIQNDQPYLVYKLHKPLYGLKQAPRCWWHEINTNANGL